MILWIGLLVMSFAAVAMFVLGEYGIVTKVIVCLMAVSAVCLQFVPALNESVHFLVPLFMQLILCGVVPRQSARVNDPYCGMCHAGRIVTSGISV